MPVTYCEMFPGKIATKNAAVTPPTAGLIRAGARINDVPSANSTTPELTTTKSVSSGTQVGTCAWNSSRRLVRWPVPAVISAAPRRALPRWRAVSPARFLRVEGVWSPEADRCCGGVFMA